MSIYKKPVLFTLVVTVVILLGTAVMMVYPMFSKEMHPKMAELKPYTALQLAGRDVYIENGCYYCHSQMIRPLKAEVMRYGEYSKAGEFAYDQPFLWGSKRKGPDLARQGGKYSDEWHYKHMADPRKLFPGSNMPAFGWLADYKVDAKDMEKSMQALGFPYSKEEIDALAGKTKLDAVVAYLQCLGTSVSKKPKTSLLSKDEKNPFKDDPTAIAEGKKAYDINCAACHGDDGKGGVGPDLTDREWLYVKKPIADATLYAIIFDGTSKDQLFENGKAKGGMPPWGDALGKKKVWSLVSYIRSIEKK
jgi:cytochrome c oxidase cbb3-type subunit 2